MAWVQGYVHTRTVSCATTVIVGFYHLNRTAQFQCAGADTYTNFTISANACDIIGKSRACTVNMSKCHLQAQFLGALRTRLLTHKRPLLFTDIVQDNTLFIFFFSLQSVWFGRLLHGHTLLSWSVGWSIGCGQVGQLVGWSVGRSVSQSIRRQMFY